MWRWQGRDLLKAGLAGVWPPTVVLLCDPVHTERRVMHQGGLPAGLFKKATYDEMRAIASNPHTRALFAAAGISSVDEIVQRSVQVQDDALQGDAKRPYACVLRGAFLWPRILEHPLYSQLMAKEGLGQRRILDLGCCMGTDLRQMILDGAPRELIRGADYSSDFIKLGFRLFGDEATLRDVFERVDILDGWNPDIGGDRLPTSGWVGKHVAAFDLVHCGAFLHTFESKEEVREVLKRILLVLAPGGVCFGSNRPTWVHDMESLRDEMLHLGFQGVHVMERSGSQRGAFEDVAWRTLHDGQGTQATFFVAYRPTSNQ